MEHVSVVIKVDHLTLRVHGEDSRSEDNVLMAQILRIEHRQHECILHLALLAFDYLGHILLVANFHQEPVFLLELNSKHLDEVLALEGVLHQGSIS